MENTTNLEIIVPTRDLVHALNFAGSVVEKRNIITELSYIKLCTKNGMLEIGATDMDLYLNQELGAEIISDGEITVPSQTLFEIIKKIPDPTVKIKQTTTGKIEIIGNNCRFDLPSLSATQFPRMVDLESDQVLTVPCQHFVRLIEHTNFAMSNEETRYNLNGIYLHIKNNKQLYTAATDGHRLSVSSCIIDEMMVDFGVILPKKAVAEILKIIKDTRHIHNVLTISLSTNKIKFVCGNIVLTSKLIDGIFPEYSSFIPTITTSKLTINAKILADAIDRVATVTVDKFRAIKITLNGTSIQISASGEAKGAALENVSFSHDERTYCQFDGEEMVIGFNPKYLHDVFSVLRDNQIELHLNDAFSPVLIKTTSYPNDDFVVMPVKV